MQQALAVFMRVMVSTNSRWDQAFTQVFDPNLPDKGVNKPLPGFIDEENHGCELFMAPRAAGGQPCAACHRAALLRPGWLGTQRPGRRGNAQQEIPLAEERGAPVVVLHDGRFSSLDEVVEHYSSDVRDGPAVHARLKDANGAPLKPNLSPQNKAALVAFMKTLSNPVLAADARFASPFRADAGLP